MSSNFSFQNIKNKSKTLSGRHLYTSDEWIPSMIKEFEGVGMASVSAHKSEEKFSEILLAQV